MKTHPITCLDKPRTLSYGAREMRECSRICGKDPLRNGEHWIQGVSTDNIIQLAVVLLQREERTDLAQVLDAAELEDLELRESPAGQLVAQRLGGTTATEAQRRAVFRLERDFDERFGFAFDLATEALAERARVRRETDEKIQAVLGEELFREWRGAASR